MTRLAPADPKDLPPGLADAFKDAEALMGFTANDVLTMARWPDFLLAVKGLVDVVYAPGALEPGLKRLIGAVVSGAAGCRYCQAHAAHGAVTHAGVDPAKLEAVWSFETDNRFTPAERATLRLAQAAGVSPNAATDTHFHDLQAHFSEQAILEIMGVISLFGLLNRWNQTVDTDLETAPSAFLATPATGAPKTPGAVE